MLLICAFQIPTDLHPATKKSALETVLTVEFLFHIISCKVLRMSSKLLDFLLWLALCITIELMWRKKIIGRQHKNGDKNRQNSSLAWSQWIRWKICYLLVKFLVLEKYTYVLLFTVCGIRQYLRLQHYFLMWKWLSK